MKTSWLLVWNTINSVQYQARSNSIHKLRSRNWEIWKTWESHSLCAKKLKQFLNQELIFFVHTCSCFHLPALFIFPIVFFNHSELAVSNVFHEFCSPVVSLFCFHFRCHPCSSFAVSLRIRHLQDGRVCAGEDEQITWNSATSEQTWVKTIGQRSERTFHVHTAYFTSMCKEFI